jgi:hypothetical protein
MRLIVSTESEKRNLELMQTLDDAWNGQHRETIDERHQIGLDTGGRSC